MPGTALDGSSATGPGIRPTPPIGSQIPAEQGAALCAQIKEDREAVNTRYGRLSQQSGRLALDELDRHRRNAC